MATAARVPRTPKTAVPPRLPQRTFTVAEYHRLIEIGMLTEGDRCELVRGFIVEKPRINPPHATTTTTRLMNRLLALVRAGAHVRVQSPVTLADSEPQPDFVVAAGTDDDYTEAHPGPKDVLLVIEVSDASLPDDQTTKLELYADNKLPEYWVVNIPDRRIEVYTRPRGGKAPAYRTRTDYGPEDAVPVTLARTVAGTIPVREILPR